MITKVWKKTAKGEEELLTRKYGLPQNLRHVLILIDGMSNEAKILQKGSVLPDDVAGCLKELARQEYIQDALAVMTVADAKKELVRIAQETLGPDSGKVADKIREAPDHRDGLEAAMNRCKKLVRMIIDEKKADELIERCSLVLGRIP